MFRVPISLFSFPLFSFYGFWFFRLERKFSRRYASVCDRRGLPFRPVYNRALFRNLVVTARHNRRERHRWPLRSLRHASSPEFRYCRTSAIVTTLFWEEKKNPTHCDILASRIDRINTKERFRAKKERRPKQAARQQARGKPRHKDPKTAISLQNQSDGFLLFLAGALEIAHSRRARTCGNQVTETRSLPAEKHSLIA